VLIAGGIGVTPILSMVRRLQSIGRSWQLAYAVRSRNRAAFLEPLRELAAAGASRLQLHVDEEQGGRLLDLDSLVSSAPPDSHFYCCGPGPMLQAYKRATASLPPRQVHLEYFGADVAPAAGGFVVVLARSGRKVPVPAGTSILAALGAAGVYVPRVCEQGVCGTCETRVLAGVPDHRDLFLTTTEQAAGKTMLICCSGSLTDELVLDL
jgi:vanillate O-demethylase ferredoxin subunit